MSASARDAAVRALLSGLSAVSRELDRAADEDGLSRQDAALARELALGCVRRRATLRAVVRAFLNRPDMRLSETIEKILHVGVYQVLFLDRIPSFAAVSEAVEQTSRFGQKRQRGFVNGLLRAVVRSASELARGEVPLAPNVVPVGPVAYRTLQHAVFPDPKRDRVGYLAAAMSLPPPLASRWIKEFGSVSAAMVPGLHANVRAPLIVRVNRRKADVATAVGSVEAEGVAADPHVNGLSVVVGRERRLTELAVFTDGWIQPQDPTATAVGTAVAPAAGMNVLDLCAAPGTKTTHLAELMDDTGSITAVDSPSKLEKIEANCRRLGLTIVRTLGADRVAQLEAASFDLVLVDVPCSNTGVLARRAEARWRFTEERLRKLVESQKCLLSGAERFVRPGGRLVYSTCSLEPEECGQLVEGFLRKQPRLGLADATLIMPAGASDPRQWHDGGYVAIFQAKRS